MIIVAVKLNFIGIYKYSSNERILQVGILVKKYDMKESIHIKITLIQT